MTNTKLLRIEDAAKVAAMPDRTIRRRIRAGVLPTVQDPRDNRRKLIRPADLSRMLGETGEEAQAA